MEITTSIRGGQKLSFQCHAYTKKGTNKITLRWECSHHRSQLRLVVECYVIVVIIKLQTDFNLSTIIEKVADVLGGKYPRRQMSGRGEGGQVS